MVQKSVSQRTAQKKMVGAGRCAICGKKRPMELRILCRHCHDMANESHHKRGSGVAA